MNCTYCNKPIVLVPSAAERSKATGLPASYFLGLFTIHDKCQIEKRNKETSKLMQRINKGQ